jgi:NAD(P)-dependent dehydrogenase (short-subunit alcohol dehydrogenase family)
MQRTMLVTGAASGIGRAIAIHFAQHGWFVGLADIDRNGLAEAAKTIDTPHLVIPLDVRESESWSRAVSEFAAANGPRMDVFVNNAGVAHIGNFEDIPPSEAIETIDVNLSGAVRGIYACLPLLKATPGGHLINMSSSSGLFGYPALAVYSATKAGIMALSEALSIELAGQDIHVTTIAPHFVDTPMLASTYHTRHPDPQARRGQALKLVRRYGVERVVAAVERAIAEKPSRIVVGSQAMHIDWLSRIAPGLLRSIMRHRWHKMMGR